MKSCPTCYQRYDDDTLRFCLEDGAPLSNVADSEATRVLPSQPVFNLLPTTVWRPPTAAAAAPRSPNKMAYAVVAIAALIAGGGLVWFLLPRAMSGDQSQTSTIPTDARPAQQPGTVSNSVPAASGKLTEPAVQELITAWARAQNEKDLPSYSSCYAAEFKGLKRTKSGRIYSYDFNGWMKDRWNMIRVAAGLNVEVRSLRITLEGDSANVEFDQYYHSLKYRDWGPKLMKVKLAPTGAPKIIYEELKASYPL